MTSLNHLWNTLKNCLLFRTNGKITSPKTLPFTKPPRLKKYICNHALISIRQQTQSLALQWGKRGRQVTSYIQRRRERVGGGEIRVKTAWGAFKTIRYISNPLGLNNYMMCKKQNNETYKQLKSFTIQQY